jgi:hypothetical protein
MNEKTTIELEKWKKMNEGKNDEWERGSKKKGEK